MSEKTILKLKKKVSILENMLEEKTRSLFMAKEEVEAKSAFIEAVINSTHEMILAIDQAGKVELLNRSALEKLGIKEGENGLGIRSILGNDIVDSLIEEEKNNRTQVESTIRPSGKSEIPALVSRTKLSQDHEKGHVYSITDMTMIKEKEQIIESQRAQLVQNGQLASLGEMASGIAHEINNPVAVMEGQVRRLKEYLTDKEITTEERVQLATKIQNNLKRVVNIVDGIRKISRKGDSDKILPLDVTDLFLSLQNLCYEKFRNNHAGIKIHKPDKPLQVLTKETQLLQVLINLVSNSSDAIEDLEEKWVSIQATPIQDKVEVRVTDSGRGIKPEVLNKMFNPFFTTKDIGKGTGIGLSISKKMMEEHGGDLKYELDNGNTSFVITLKKTEGHD